MEKKKRLEDVIPDDILKSILHVYRAIKSVRSLHLRDHMQTINEGSKLQTAIKKAGDTGFLDNKLMDGLIEIVDRERFFKPEPISTKLAQFKG